MESYSDSDQYIMHCDVNMMSPSQCYGGQVSPQSPDGLETGPSGLIEPGGVEDGGDGGGFHCVSPHNSQPTFSQFISGPFPDLPSLQSSLFQFPLDAYPRVATGYSVDNVDAAWTSEKSGHFGMISAELCSAVESIAPDSEEEDFLRQDLLFEQRLQSGMDMSQPSLMTVFLKPLYPPGEGMAPHGATACQILSSIDSRQQMVQSAPAGYMPLSSEPQFQRDIAEFGTSFWKGSAIQMEKMVPFAVPELCPVLPQPYLAPPLIGSTSTLFVPPNPLGPAYNFLSGPCFSQFHQTPCSVYPDSQPKMPPIGLSAAYWDSKSRKPCSCTKSQCLKLYCDCFANGDICSNCKCINCYNNKEHAYERYQAIKISLDRNPEAFRPKIGNGRRGEVKGRHNKGCNCKRSGCLKNYCECYEAKIMCSSICKCVSCRNYDESPERQTMMSADSVGLPDSGLYVTALSQNNNCPLAGLTLGEVESTCARLLAQAEEAEKEGYTVAQAEKMILKEFGQCLTQIVRSIFKSGH